MAVMAGAALVLALVFISTPLVQSNESRGRQAVSHDRHKEHRKTSCLQMKDNYHVVPLQSWGSLPVDLQKLVLNSSTSYILFNDESIY